MKKKHRLASKRQPPKICKRTKRFFVFRFSELPVYSFGARAAEWRAHLCGKKRVIDFLEE